MYSLIEALLDTPWLFWPALALLSLCIGSFLNVVILRLPRMMEQAWQTECRALLADELDGNSPGGSGYSRESAQISEPYSLSAPRSHCPQCGHAISALENIPVISWLVLRGRCRGCGTAISVRYPLVELLTMILSVVTVAVLGLSGTTLITLGLVWALIALTVIDLDTQLLPDSITLPLLWAGLLFNYFGGLTDLESAFLGAVAGYLSLWSVYQVFRLVTGKEGMGFGDFKLLAALGAWLGWTMLPAIILLSSLVGATVGILMMVFHNLGRDMPSPFGPYLAAAGLLCLWWGPELQQFWYRFLGV